MIDFILEKPKLTTLDFIIIGNDNERIASIDFLNEFDWDIFIDYCNTPCYLYKASDIVIMLEDGSILCRLK